jgi:DNA-binding transcriptional LysR family regulator
MKQLNLNLLRVLDTLMQERSVTRAAERLHLTQPAVSSALNRLRTAFDDPLFMPTRRGIVPTPRAFELAARASTVLKEVEAMVEPRTFDPATARASFVIGANDFGVISVVAPLLERLVHAAPEMQLHVKRLEPDISAQLARQDIDLAITLLTEPSRPAYVHPLFRESFTGTIRRDHPMAGQAPTLDHFCAMHQVRVSAADTRLVDPVDDALAEVGRRRRIVLTMPSFLSLPRVLGQTDLISVAPQRMVTYFRDTLAEVPIPLKLPGFTLNMIWDDRTQTSESHKWLRAELIDLFD